MEEHKAAAYYEELLQKGGGAARFKQGLGYGGNPKSEVPFGRGDACSLFSKFVKQASPERASLIQKEIALDGIRSKLQKPKDGGAAEEISKTSVGRRRSISPSVEKQGRRHSRERHRGSHRRIERSRSPVRRRSVSRSSLSYSSEEDERRRNSSRRKESSHYHSHTRRRRSISRSSASGSSEGRDSYRKSHRSRRSCKERSLSPGDRRHANSSRRDNGNVRKGARRDRRGSSRSLSPTNAKEKKDRDCNRSERRKDADAKSSKPGFKEKTDSQPSEAADPKALAERVKAKMKLQLHETVAKDKAKGFSEEWERFDFNKDAPLDDDAKLDYFGDGTGTHDDTEFLKNAGHSFLSSITQAKREADVEAAHEAAIFGARVTSANVNAKSSTFGLGNPEVRSLNDADNVNLEKQSIKASLSDVPAVSEKVLEMQKISWQERVRMIKAAKGGGAT